MTAPFENSRSLDAVFRRLQQLEAEVTALRDENERLRGGQRSSGEYSLSAAESEFTQPGRTATLPPPPTYKDLPAVAPPAVPRLHHDAPRASGFAPPPPANVSPPSGVDVGYVNRVDEEQLDQLPYGLVVIDRTGRVLFYNETEARLTGFSRARVIGRNFFREVAPCTAVQGFEGIFRDFVAGKRGRSVFFDFAFHFSSGTQNVTIALSSGRRAGQVNVMMMRR